MAVIAASGLSKSYSARLLFEGVGFEIAPRDRVGLVGVNGCGKTTLFRILTGQEKPDSGTVMRGRGLTMGYMSQSVEEDGETLYNYTLSAFEPLMELERELERVSGEISGARGDVSELVRRQDSLNQRYQRGGGLTYRSRARSALMGLGFGEGELSKPMGALSGGQRNKAQLARMLLSGAELLLLDEPTNHLDIRSVEWLEEYLRSYQGAFMVISHDRYFLDKVTNRTMELKNCRLACSNGGYSRHMELMSSRSEIDRRHYLNQQKEIRRLEGVVEQQRRWGQAHNFVTAESKLKQIQRLKAQLVAPERDPASIRFSFEAKEPGGNDVLICEDLAKSYGKEVFKGVSMHLRRGEKVFLLGPNGCGKSTLMRLIMGRERPDSGRVKLGAKVQPGYYDQNVASIDPSATALEEVHNTYPHMTLTEVRNAMAAFLITGDDVFKNTQSLSGGEKARVQLLKLMLSGANLLLLDEPTNHLDIASREALEGALEEYRGTLLVVTHDRYLVNRLADRILAMGPEGLEEYIGGYDDYLAALSEREAAREEREAKQPNGYRAKKERQGQVNRAAGEVRRAEERIAKAEAELEAINLAMADPDVAADYREAGRLAREAAEKQAEIEELYGAWEEACGRLEELQAGP